MQVREQTLRSLAPRSFCGSLRSRRVRCRPMSTDDSMCPSYYFPFLFRLEDHWIRTGLWRQTVERMPVSSSALLLLFSLFLSFISVQQCVLLRLFCVCVCYLDGRRFLSLIFFIQHADVAVNKILIGNKCDMDEDREVSTEPLFTGISKEPHKLVRKPYQTVDGFFFSSRPRAVLTQYNYCGEMKVSISIPILIPNVPVRRRGYSDHSVDLCVNEHVSAIAVFYVRAGRGRGAYCIVFSLVRTG